MFQSSGGADASPLSDLSHSRLNPECPHPPSPAPGSPLWGAFHTCLNSCRRPAHLLQSPTYYSYESPALATMHRSGMYYIPIYVSATFVLCVFHWPSPFPWFVSFLFPSKGSQCLLECFVLLCWLHGNARRLQISLFLAWLPSIISSHSRQGKPLSFVPPLPHNMTGRFKGKDILQAQHMKMSKIIICFRVLPWCNQWDWWRILNSSNQVIHLQLANLCISTSQTTSSPGFLYCLKCSEVVLSPPELLPYITLSLC